MPIDIKGNLYGIWLGIINTGISNYNAAFPAQPSISPVLDNRTTGRFQAKVSGDPASFPQTRLSITGGIEGKTVTPTFGLMQGATCDAIIPRTVQLELSIAYDPASIGDTSNTMLEACIDASMHAAGYPKFGINYLRFFTLTDRRRDEKIDGRAQTVFRRQMNFDLWPHLVVTQ